ncbi:ATP-binding cassette domain-containing protein|nr:ATP-binding cassette domain-containing protein [archaeon]
MTVIEFKDFKWHYFEREEHDLQGVNLKIKKGEFVGLLGPSGSGKTAFCYSIMGVVPHLSQGRVKGGKVIIDGLDTQDSSIGELSSRVGIIMQSPKSQLTGAGLTIEEEVAFGLENTGVPRSEMGKRIKSVLKRVGLYELRKRSPFEVSGGQMQKVGIASVLVLEPKILILDEPTGYLDPGGTEAVFSLVKKLNNQGKTIIIVTHKLEYLARYADRIILFNNGRVVRDGSPQEILSDTKLLKRNKIDPLPVTLLGEALKKKRKWKQELPITVKEAVEGLRKVVK